MEFYKTQETSNPEMVTHIWIHTDNTLHGICVEKNVSIEDALQMLIDVQDDDNSPLGLS